MLVPLSWLKEYIDLDLSVDELVKRMTLAGMEVEGVEYIGVEGGELPWDPDKIFVCNILEVRQHPNADKLVLADVDYGAEKPHTVVTGAPNLYQYRDKGPLSHPLKSVFAKEGSRLYDGHQEGRVIVTLKGRPVRGVMSDAMLCSEKELGISDEHEGILILPDDAPVGTPLRDYMGEVVLDVALTPNLSRCLSIIGMAREISALTGLPLKLPEGKPKANGKSIEGRVKVTVEDSQLCPRFMAGLAEDIKIGPSPFWMQQRLRYAGMRPINNVVDISNYVMLEWGGPSHFFDADKVTDGHLVIRPAKEGERLTTLDGKPRELSAGQVLVCDPTGPLSLAGVMGGESSEVSDSTTRILVEAATWEPTSIRRTGQTFKLRSEASYRYERNVDSELLPTILNRCLQLLEDLAGATVAQGAVDVYGQPWQPYEMELPAREVKRLLGIELSAEEIAAQLAPLGFEPVVQGSGPEASVKVKVPSWRRDVQFTADLVEDVARLYGYDKIPATLLPDELPAADPHPELELEQKVRDLLAGAGLNEAITYPLTNMEWIARIDPAAADPSKYVRLANPSTPEREFMRHHVLTSLLEPLALNLREREKVQLFEIGRAYLPVEGELLPNEPLRLAIAMAGPRDLLAWHTPSNKQVLDFFDLKGVIEMLIERLGIEHQVMVVPCNDDPRLHPGRAARLVRAQGRKLGKKPVPDAAPLGVFGELHPQVRQRLELPAQRVAVAELELGELLAMAVEPRYHSISRFPATIQDFAVIVDRSIPASRVQAVLDQAAGNDLESITLFDVYEGPQVGEGKRSLAYRLSFRAADRTLSDETLVKVRAKIIKSLERELGASIRA
jgi:phenylalanyl-tRNA synthetase, beta subunit, non-spirochete bacterial